MRRLVVMIAIATVAFLAAGTAPSDAAPGDECTSKSLAPVQVATVPAVPLFRFKVGDQEYATGSDGTARFPASQCGTVVAIDQDRSLGEGSRLRFQRWFGGRTGGYTATFYADSRVQMKYLDRRGRPYPARKIDSAVIKNSLGVHQRFRPGGSMWLLGSRVVRRANGLHQSRVYWTLEDAQIGGLGVVNRNQLKFYPDEMPTPVAHLLLFEADVHAFDAFFGLDQGGAKLKLMYPNGRIEFHTFDGNGRLMLSNLPRGQYDMVVIGSGLKMKSPVAVTRNQEVDLKVLTYLDLTAVALVGLALSGGLLAYGLHRRRRLLRDGEETSAPTSPEDLERFA